MIYTRLRLQLRDYELWDQIRQKAHPLGKSVEWYADDGIQTIDTDSYGDQLTYLTAAELAPLLTAGSITKEYHGMDQAACAFMEKLSTTDPHWEIVLFWH